jgi:hypothetical protein
MLTPGEIAKGQYITVLKWKKRDIQAMPLLGVAGGEYTDRSYVGNVLQVLSVDLPFVLVARLTEHYKPNERLQLDTRELFLKELSAEFAETAIGEMADGIVMECAK